MKKLLFIFCFLFLSVVSGKHYLNLLNAKINAIENGLRPTVLIEGAPKKKMNILERMKYYNVPAVSIAVVNGGMIEWAKGYGHYSRDPSSPVVDEHTLFQAGSVSKPLTAYGALLLVQQGKVSLDADVNQYLKKWKIPENEFTKTEKVTLRRLISHTAGTSVSGFPGYDPQTPLPELVDILEGKKPKVNSEPVRVIIKPGTEMKYSGGGTTIVQLLIEEITGQPFDVWMQDNVLNPLGMNESTFKQPLPPPYAEHAAYGYTKTGEVKGRWHAYPEMAAAGLWTTPKDLAKFLLNIQKALRSQKSEPLNTPFVKEMIARQKTGDKETDMGLGVFLEGQGQNLIFEHNGQNEGFISKLLGFANLGKGVVIMINDDSGWLLMEEITNSIGDMYKWPNIKPIEKKEIPIPSATISYITGLYFHEQEQVEVASADNKVTIDLKNGLGPLKLHLKSDCKFFIQEADITIEFSSCSEQSKSVVIIDPKQVKTIYVRKAKNMKE